ncbi:FadR/GntR family transcriptional regulator [Rhodococcoides kroppenstedtii]|uniref:FadR/GntR family transcriptional regulator n=1 Tax=Rhodococcoides kroppenstedtii TaxID=293050 RepID=UPI003643A40C
MTAPRSLDRPLSAAVWHAAIESLASESRPVAVTRRLQQAIALGLIPDGSALPSESDFATQLNVSTVTLRSSLAELRRQGLIVTRRGRGGGSFVRVPQDSDASILREQLAEWNIDEIRDLRDFHLAVAGSSAALSAERVRGRTLDRLRMAAETVNDATNCAQALRADFRFHLELAASTRSAHITRAEMSIQSDLAPLLWIPGMESQSQATACAQHLAIVDAIVAGDPEQARRAAEKHVHDALSNLIDLRMRLTVTGDTDG